MAVSENRIRVRIGMEVHAQILTTSKMFCGCSTAFNASPNVHTCPVCLGYPGSLPVTNALAVEKALSFAVAIGASLSDTTVLERKNYAYPDLPKGFQISQYRVPLARNGSLRFWFGDRVTALRIRRIQIEEDTARMIHLNDRTLLDFNRSGVPLMEIVSEPDLSSSEEAVAFLLELRNILRVLQVCDGNIEEGSLRAEPNVSIVYNGSEFPRIELKNLGSIRSVHLAIDHEVERQTRLAMSGVSWSRETRGFDEKAGSTYPLRLKEAEEDYRYFPEPDLPPLSVNPEQLARLSQAIPELPCARRQRWQDTFQIPASQAGVLISDPALAAFFEDVLRALGSRGPELGRIAANWVVADLLGQVAPRGGIPAIRFQPSEIARLAILVADEAITGKSAKTVLMNLVDHGGTTDHWVRVLGLSKTTDESEIAGWITEALEQEQSALASYLAGKDSAFTALMGALMRVSRGRADPAIARRLLLARLQSLRQQKEVVSGD
ncbi:MAG: Asp-tRNA(Asn)/Glu-tRNA(Gln) amidotransferase subunit GatB [bacterium JZ-2024 1]